jgi:NAD(P)-dependent dehydrogenase (short-subunit alcohol dehydrogenase family)
MARVLITGASRGIGLEFARQYRAAGWDVVATCRRPEAAPELAALGTTVAALDVTDPAAIDRVAAALGPASLDLFVCNAGAVGLRTPLSEPLEIAEFDAVMRTNVFGPSRLVTALASRIADGGRIAVLSSKMGSLGAMTTSRAPLYRASKAAVNAIGRAAALELAPRGIVVVMLHPGWVRTDLGGPQAEVDVGLSVAAMRRLIDGAGAGQSGHFYEYDGTELPW